MRFRYQYRTSENEVRGGEISAADRDSAYAALRSRGIKASRLEESPGFFNKLFGKGKRWLAIAVLAIIAVSLFLHLRLSPPSAAVEAATPRHQIYGDPEIVAKFAGYNSLLWMIEPDCDALLACFAQPGKVAVIPPNLKIEELLAKAMKADQRLNAEDSREVRELKQIVNWIRAELVAFVNNPEDERTERVKFRAYFNHLASRAEEERRIYDLVKDELSKDPDESVREEKNARLRRLGLPPIVSEEPVRPQL